MNSLISRTILLESKGARPWDDILVNTFSIRGEDLGPVPCLLSHSGKEGWPPELNPFIPLACSSQSLGCLAPWPLLLGPLLTSAFYRVMKKKVKITCLGLDLFIIPPYLHGKVLLRFYLVLDPFRALPAWEWMTERSPTLKIDLEHGHPHVDLEERDIPLSGDTVV